MPIYLVTLDTSAGDVADGLIMVSLTGRAQVGQELQNRRLGNAGDSGIARIESPSTKAAITRARFAVLILFMRVSF